MARLKSKSTSMKTLSNSSSRVRLYRARPKDVKTIDAIIHSLYAVISGPAGQKHDWDRFRALFLSGARLVLAIAKKGTKPKARILDVQGYIRRTTPIFAIEDFWEREKKRTIESFGNIAHVFSTYESRRTKTGKVFQAGVNSIQLFHDGTRWWIVTVMWNTDRE